MKQGGITDAHTILLKAVHKRNDKALSMVLGYTIVYASEGTRYQNIGNAAMYKNF